jgi:UDP-N-acetylglucosamine 2-epimerase (non-hydrolysing)
MLDQVIEAFDLPAHRDFDLMRPGQTLTRVTAAVLESLEKAFAEERPDCVLVQGDTTTVAAAALAAFYARVPVGHVEAGLRTWDKFAPYPEEMNRQIATRLADFHFAPTPASRDNLIAERIAGEAIWVTGNTVIDALAIAAARVRRERPPLPEGFPLKRLADGRKMVLITGHRRESFGAGFDSICRAIAALARRYPAVEWIYPVHLNPNVREPVFRILSGLDNIHLIEPLAYLPFVWAMDRCHFLLSDSGGVQEEAPHLGKPVLVMREKTERPEALDAGTSRLVGNDEARIVAEASRLLDDPAAYDAMSHAANPFGDGRASVRIADALAERL